MKHAFYTIHPKRGRTAVDPERVAYILAWYDPWVRMLAILEKYSLALTVLDDYDHQRLQVSGIRTAAHPAIGYDEAMAQILRWREQEGLESLFGNESVVSEYGIPTSNPCPHSPFAPHHLPLTTYTLTLIPNSG